MPAGVSTPAVKTPYVCACSQANRKDSLTATPGQSEGMPMVTFNLRKQQQGELFEAELERLSALAADMEACGNGVPPETLIDGPAPVLDGWIIAQRPIACLAGLSSGHPRLPGANRAIVTSDLWLLSSDRSWARTLSRWYRLGRPAGHPADHS